MSSLPEIASKVEMALQMARDAAARSLAYAADTQRQLDDLQSQLQHDATVTQQVMTSLGNMEDVVNGIHPAVPTPSPSVSESALSPDPAPIPEPVSVT